MNAGRNLAKLDALTAVPAELRAPVERWLSRLADAGFDAARDVPQASRNRETMLRLVASSEFAAAVLLQHWQWFLSELASGGFDRTPDPGMELTDAAGSNPDEAAFKAELRRVRNRTLVHILWRSVRGDADVWETLESLSGLADLLIDACQGYARATLEHRFGIALAPDGSEIPLVVLAMGKLGGRELNFSSDVDLIFLYREEGETNGRRKVSAHEYFTRASRQVVNLLEEVTADGFVYRVDTRLRPFGDSGPPVASFPALENYLLQHGRGWERYAYVKARIIASRLDEADRRELLSNVIEPFVYRRYLDYGVFESLREMKALIEVDVKRRELSDNVKLGPGGIREIEFIAQALQLVRGGADPGLRCRGLRTALSRLGRERDLGRETARSLIESYEFLRRFENGLQAIRDQQTHDIPVDELDRSRLCLVMGYDGWPALSAALQAHRDRVGRAFGSVAFRGDDEPRGDGLGERIATHWRASAGRGEWQEFLASEQFDEADELGTCIAEFAATPLRRQIDATAVRRLDRFVRSLLLLLHDRRKPAAVCHRILAIVSGVARRSAYIALLNENPAVLGRLVVLCDQSAYLAAEIARFPLLLDELLDPRLHTAGVTAASMREDLAERLGRVDSGDSELVIETLAKFQRATLFRIAVADVSGALPIMKVSDRLTELAEIVLNAALDVAWRDLAVRHGEPRSAPGRDPRIAGFGVIAYGKFGGFELSYRSDLDLVFLHDSGDTGQTTDGDRPLDNSMFFSRLVRRLVHFLTAQTGSGALYDVDTRLRPSGRSGLLVVSLEGFEKYQEENAWTWEHQALLRSRPVAGSAGVAREFERIRADTLRLRVRRDKLLEDVVSMRQRMRDQLDTSSDRQFDLKQGAGGIGDIEFLVQFMVLKHADEQPALIHYPDNIRQLGTLDACGYLPAADAARLQETYRAYRLRMHRLALDGKPALVSSDEFAGDREFVTAVWAREMTARH